MSRTITRIHDRRAAACARAFAFCLLGGAPTVGCRELGNLRKINSQQEQRIAQLDQELSKSKEEFYQLQMEKGREVDTLKVRIDELSRQPQGGRATAAPVRTAAQESQTAAELSALRAKMKAAQEDWDQRENDLKTSLAAALQENKDLRGQIETARAVEASPTALASTSGMAGAAAFSPLVDGHAGSDSSTDQDLIETPRQPPAGAGPPSTPEAVAASPDPTENKPQSFSYVAAPAKSGSTVNWTRVQEEVNRVLADPLKKKQVVFQRRPEETRIVVWSRLVFSADGKIASHIEPFLKAVGKIYSDEPDGRVMIEGHSDSGGEEALTQRQAETVARYLSDNSNLKSSRIETRGLGDQSPLPEALATDPSNSPRRIEIILRPAAASRRN